VSTNTPHIKEKLQKKREHIRFHTKEELQQLEQEIKEKLEQEIKEKPQTTKNRDEDEKYDMYRRYNIIDLITIEHMKDKNIVSKCALFNELICALIQYSYEQMNLMKYEQLGLTEKNNGKVASSGWGNIYILCEIIFNSNFFFIKFEHKFHSEKFIELYKELYKDLFNIINENSPDIIERTFIDLMLKIYNKFQSKISKIDDEIDEIKDKFLYQITHDLPISFLFKNSIPIEFVTGDIPDIYSKLRFPNRANSNRANKDKVVVKPTMQHVKSPPSQYMLHTDMRNLVTVGVGGSNYKNNIITKLKVKKQATKRRENKSRKHKSRKHKSRKHKSRKHKSRKHKSKKSRKNKRLKKYT
jgi:hypothetical protein